MRHLLGEETETVREHVERLVFEGHEGSVGDRSGPLGRAEGQALERGGELVELDEPVLVSVTAYVPIPKSFSKQKREAAEEGTLKPGVRPDVDNFSKAALDGCNAIVFRDDSLVTDLIARKRYSHRPRLVVAVLPVASERLAPPPRPRRPVT